MKIKEEALLKLVETLAITRDEELECGDCNVELDSYVDMLRAGESPEVIKPLVKHHLEMCGNCHEEFQALLAALDAIEKEEPNA
jgi:hypothetical protein